MKPFSDYLNKIKAEEDLKEKTKGYVRDALSKKSPGNVTFTVDSPDKGKLFRRRLAPLISVAACAILVLSGFAYYHTPVNYLSLDINPSIELGINAFNKVVSVESYNDDGAALLIDNDLSGLTPEEAVDNLVQKAAEHGFIAKDGSTVIALTAETKQKENAVGLLASSQNGATTALTASKMPAIVYTDCSDLELRTRAKAMEISPGKYKLILLLQALDPDIIVDQYRNVKITDIITKANELLTAAAPEQYQEFDTAIEMIQKTAQGVQLARGLGAKEKNQNAIQNQGQTQNHDQNPPEIVPKQKSDQTQSTTNPEQRQNSNQKFNETTSNDSSNSGQNNGSWESQKQINGNGQQQGNSGTGKKGQ